jgi:hypothetical protein
MRYLLDEWSDPTNDDLLAMTVEAGKTLGLLLRSFP